MLSAGAVRLRLAIDIHLGRWGRAAAWLCVLAAAEVRQRGFAPTSSRAPAMAPPASVDEAAAPLSLRDLWGASSSALPGAAEAVVAAALARPTETLLRVVVQRGLGGAGRAALAVDAPAPLRRLLAVAQGWLVAAEPPPPGATGAAAARPPVPGQHLATEPAALLLRALCPSALAARVAAAPLAQLSRAIDTMLAARPPAIDEALTLATQAAGEVAAPLRGDALAWRFAQLQAALPLSCVRTRRWPAYAFAGAAAAVTIASGDVQPPPLPPPPPPSTEALARAAVAALGRTPGPDARRETGRILVSVLGDPEEGVTALCEGRAWSEAAGAATSAQRLDLVDTVLLPSLVDAATAAVTDLHGRREELAEAWGRLVRVRALRASLPLEELVGAAEAGAALRGGGRRGGGGGGNGDDAEGLPDDDGAGSLWSSASSVMSGVGGPGGGGGDAHSVVSGGSGASGRSSASSRAGLFSHLSAASTGQRLVESRSLRLAGGGLSRREAASLDHQAALRAATRKELAHHRDGGNSKPGRSRRHRPGSSAEEATCEADATALLPVPGSSVVLETAALAAQLAECGCANEADAVEREFDAWVAEVAALPPLPPRRDEASELLLLRHGVGGPPLLANPKPSPAAAAAAPSVEALRASVRRLQSSLL